MHCGNMKIVIGTLLLAFIMCGCSDVIKKERVDEAKGFEDFWTKEEQINRLRKRYKIPKDYSFYALELTSFCHPKDEDGTLFNYVFRFSKTLGNFIDIKVTYYWDADSVVFYEIKQEKIVRNKMKATERTYEFTAWPDGKEW